MTIEKLNVQDIVELNMVQKGMLYHYLRDTEDNIYNAQLSLTIKGSLDSEILKKALAVVQSENQALRSVFRWQEVSKPLQIILKKTPVDFSYHDISKDSPARIASFIHEYTVNDQDERFDLGRSALRLSLIKTNEEYFILFITHHHILYDGWSTAIFLKELFHCYARLADRQDPVLAGKPAYNEVLTALQKLSRPEKEEAYWKNYLENYEITALFPRKNTAAGRAPVQKYKGTISKTKLESFAFEHKLTKTSVIYAAYAILLSKYSARTDIVFGTTVSTRDAAIPGHEKIIGNFINTIPLRVSGLEERSFREIVMAVKGDLIKREDFSRTSYPDIKRISGLQSGDILFDSIVVIENYPLDTDAVNQCQGLDIQFRSIYENTDIPLVVTVFFRQEVEIEITCKGDIASDMSPEFLIAHLRHIINELCDHSEQKAGSISLLTETERRRWNDEWNERAAPFAGKETVISLFLKQVMAAPDSTALETHAGTISYQVLKDRSDKVAVYLSANKGVRPGDLVGILLERGEDLVSGILGVWIAGAAYIPIDPAYPEDRINSIIEDARIKVLITNRSAYLAGEELPGGIVDPKDISAWSDTELAELPADIDDDSRLAYVIYTSGSTGRPKGVMIAHDSLANYIRWAAAFYVGEDPAAFPLYSSVSFDLTVTSLFTPLITGNKIVIYGEEEIGPLMEKVILEDKIDIIKCTPSHLKIIANMDFPEPLPRLRLRKFIVGGEDLETSLAKKIYDKFQQKVDIYNEYGPTEATVGCMIHKFDPEADLPSVPIGVPIGNTRIYILDTFLNPMPPGLKGDLYIAGMGLARGYLAQKELTDQRFTDNPFVKGERMYRSGDLAARLPDGILLYKGRNDEQVKIRGFRIELGEIEAHLCQQVGQSAVVVKEMRGAKFLVAYYISAEDIAAEEIRRSLAAKLPEYMIPAWYIRLTAFPLTANGKLDKKALPDPEILLTDQYIPPGTKKEKLLSGIWSKVLGAGNYSIADNFFSAGGDSIKSIQISAAARAQGYDVTVKDIFDYPTIKELAVRLKERHTISDQSPVTGQVALTPIQRRFFEKNFVDRHHYNQSRILSFPGGISEPEVRTLFGKLQQHHDALRIVFRVEGDGVTQEYKAPGIPVSVTVFDLSEDLHPQTELRSKCDELQSGINLSDGPLIRLGLFHLKDGSRLLIVIHHLVVDGISWRFLLEDIHILYRQIKEKTSPLSLPLKTDSFQSWSKNLAAYAKSDTHIKARSYWEKALQYEAISLRRDYPDGQAALKDLAEEKILLSSAMTTLLLTRAHTAFNTRMNDLLLAALSLALHKQFGYTSVLIDLEAHGREDLGLGENISRTVGWFTAIYPVMLPSTENSLPITIREVKEALRKVPNNGIDYLLGKYPYPDDVAGVVPAHYSPQISFNYLGQFDTGSTGNAFTEAVEYAGHEVSLNEKWEYDWDILGQVRHGRLELGLRYSTCQYKKDTVRKLMDFYEESLTAIIDYCIAQKEPELTPSDLTYKKLSTTQLGKLQQKYALKDIYPLSPMQKGMLFHSLYDPSSDSYFEQITCWIAGRPDKNILKKSMDILTDRYDILRTAFLREDYEQPLQIVLKDRKTNFSFRDLREVTTGLPPEEAIVSFQSQDRSRKFDLSKDVLSRLALLQTDEEQFVLIWSYHHILMDGWCMSIIIRELTDIYSALKRGSLPSLPVIPPYSRYIEWLEKRGGEASADYWKNYLEAYETVAVLPRKQTSPLPFSSYRKSSWSLDISAGQTRSLQKISREYGVSLNTILQSAWGILLAKYNNRQDVVFGTVVSGRPAEIEGIDQMIGLFINTIPVRIVYTHEDTAGELLKKVQHNALKGEPHHYHPLAEIQSATSLGGGLLDHILVFENQPFAGEMAGQDGQGSVNFRITQVQVFEQTNYDLTLVILPGECMTVRFEYNEAVYESETIERVADHLNNILAHIISDSHVRVMDINMLGSEEEQQLLKEFDYSQIKYPEEKTIIDFFMQQVQRAPDATAVKYGDETITYGQLHQRSDKLAWQLRQKGVGAGQIVGLLTDRSIATVTGILAIIKAAGAYLPIDVDYPEERINYLLKDSGASILLTERRFSQKGPYGIPVVFIEDASQMEEIPNLEYGIIPADLCYVIYTSGTTGDPKGVMVEHKNVVRLFFNEEFQFDFDEHDVWTMFHSHCFDFSVWEIFGALLFGGKLVIIPKMIAMDTREYRKILKEERVTILNQTPSAFYNLAHEEMSFQDKELILRYVIFGGEALNPAKLKSWKGKYPQSRLINMFGITETTVHVTYKELAQTDMQDNVSNVGKPIPTLSVYLFDSHRRLLPRGAVGELYVGGAGVARGYLNKETLTEQKFVRNPYDLEERLYRSGDLARILPSGDIQYMGRIDHQVQLRGFRVELAEIESHLSAHEYITENVVLAKEKEEDKCLVAYIVSAKELPVAELREFLSRKLPAYMIPSYFIRLDKLPLTSNGKLDRKALPDPESKTEEEYVAPVTKEEELLASVWSKVLGMPAAGITYNYFSAGGDSIKAIQISSGMRALGYELSVRDIFMSPTIKESARAVKKISNLLAQGPVTGEVSLTPIQKWFFNGPVINKHHYNQAVLLHFDTVLPVDRVRCIFEKIQQHHDALRMVFHRKEGKITQEYKEIDLPVSIEVADFRGKTWTGAEFFAVADSIQAGISLEEGPLMKLGLFHGEKESLLLIVIHHLVVDGVSWRILFEDIETLYQQSLAGKPFVLPVRTDSFQSWSECLSKYADSQLFHKDRQYWEAFLHKEINRIPRDYPESATTGEHSHAESFILSRSETEKLLTEVPPAFHTRINDILLTALLLGVRKKYGFTSLLLDLEGHGREDIQQPVNISRTVGWFTSIYPVMLESAGDDVRSTIKKVKEALRQTPAGGIGSLLQKYQDVGPNELQPARPGLALQICFNYLGQFDADTAGKSYSVTAGSTGNVLSPKEITGYDWQFSGIIRDGQLHMSLTYGKNQYKQETILSLLDFYRHSLLEIIAFCSAYDRTELTPSDLTSKCLPMAQLDELQEKYVLEDVYGLTPMQQGMLFHSLLNEEEAHYFEQIICRISGRIDRQSIGKGLQELGKRYTILRTIFLSEGLELPMQIVLKEKPLEFMYADIREECLYASEESVIGEYQAKDKARKFRLDKDALMRLTVLQTGEEEYIFIWSHHHIIMDGWCMHLIINDFREIYGQLRKGHKIAQPAIKPYSHYVSWMESRHVEVSADYWMNYLKGYGSLATLPQKDSSLSGLLPYHLVSETLIVTPEQAGSLHRISGLYGVTINTILQTAWAILLAKYNHTNDVTFASVVSGRPPEIEGIEAMIGLFINTIPVRINYKQEDSFADLLQQVQRAALDSEPHHYSSLPEIQSRTELERGLLDHVLIFENYPISRKIADDVEPDLPQDGARGQDFAITEVRIFEQTNYNLAIMITPGTDIHIRFDYNANVYDGEIIKGAARHLGGILEQMMADPKMPVVRTNIVTEEEKSRLLYEFNDTAADYPRGETVTSLFEQQAQKTPDKTAIVFEDKALTYKELNERSNALSRCLREQYAIMPGDSIAIMAERSETMIVGLLGILKSGAAYIPIDPTYPRQRSADILEDSQARLLLTSGDVPDDIPFNGQTLPLDGMESRDIENPAPAHTPKDLCYIIYTSGSTGKPKGVMIHHFNVVNFITGISRQLPASEDDCMLAVTSTSFDISVLEIFWTLCNGIEVVLHPSDISLSNLDRYTSTKDRSMDFSLLFFSSYSTRDENKYSLLFESVKYADREGFKAVWIPERHFHEFGGLYPNPSVISSALAMITRQIALRSGSVVSPLHDPLRIAEEWSVVDNLSGGRVGLSFASGWNPNDFSLAVDKFKDRNRIMYEQIDIVKELWKGGAIVRENGYGNKVKLQIFPKPVQNQLPVWITSSGNEETFRTAGALGANILTHLLGQDIKDLSAKIAVYREARLRHGYDAAAGNVTVMMHAYIGEDISEVEKLVEKPFTEYLKSSIGLNRIINEEAGLKEEDVSPEKKELILKNAFRRYYKTGSLIGTRSSCMEMVSVLKGIGVDEIACLVDFGLPEATVLDGLKNLKTLKKLFTRQGDKVHKPITMMQSTPSFIKLAREGDSGEFLKTLRFLLLGGEAVPLSLVRELKDTTTTEIMNMYGPTETTVWSCVHKFQQDIEKVSVGKPILNTTIYILNKELQVLPVGVAGDLYIGGEGVAMGYWDRPDLTRERFISHPFEKSGRIYKTGDMARWLPDGSLELIGREDQQIKIRGHRIELGEIESILSGYPAVQEAAVVARERDADKILIAYYVSEKEMTSDLLREQLVSRLPVYMIPSYFVRVPSMPLTPNGKIDRKALPDPELGVDDTYNPPSGETEEKLVGLWSELLGVDKSLIGVNNDFFKIGGHSLNAVILMNRIEKIFKCKITLKVFLNISTVKDMAQYIDALTGGDSKIALNEDKEEFVF